MTAQSTKYLCRQGGGFFLSSRGPFAIVNNRKLRQKAEVYTKMKKRRILLILLCGLLFSGCIFPGPGAQDTAQDATQWATQDKAQDAAPVARKTLWGRTLTVDKVPVPREAFSAGGASACRGMAPDGVTFLMTDGVIPYLYNTETGAKMTLLPADERTCELAKNMLRRSAAQQGEAELEKQEEEIAALQGEQLTEALCKLSGEEPVGPMAYLSGLQADGNYMDILFTGGGLPALIDCGTGAYYALEMMQITAVRDGKALLAPAPPSAVAKVMDLETGQITEEGFTAAGGLEGGASMKACTFLPDGSICAVLRAVNMSYEHGQPCVIAVRTPQGKEEIYPIGNIMYGKEPDLICGTEDGCIIAQSRQLAMDRLPYLADRTTGEVSLLKSEDLQVVRTPLSQLQEADGQVPDVNGDGSMIPLEAMSDGATVLLWGTSQGELLYRPSSSETQGLVPDAENGFPAPQTFCGNHYDRFWMMSFNDLTHYTQLTVQ